MNRIISFVAIAVLFMTLGIWNCSGSKNNNNSQSVSFDDNTSSPGFGVKAVTFQSHVKNNDLQFSVNIQSGYGIQKKAKNTFTLYLLDNSAKNFKTAKDKIEKAAIEVETLQKISGTTAIEDESYFSEIEPLEFSTQRKEESQYGLKAKLYVCSFVNQFCSVQTEFLLLSN